MRWFYIVISCGALFGQTVEKTSSFDQLDKLLPTPNQFRDATGSPAPAYWQQQADYTISVKLDEEKRELTGSESVVYTNHSPSNLRYIWFQLDQNKRKENSDHHLIKSEKETQLSDFMSIEDYQNIVHSFDGGFKIQSVTDEDNRSFQYVIDGTSMRVDLASPLKTGQKVTIKIQWSYKINDITIEGRSGYEFFESDSNDVYTIAQFYPRVAKFTDSRAWQTAQFLEQGEFALEFGNYDVKITVPADHILAATGDLQNEDNVLSTLQRKRLYRQKRDDTVRFIVSPEEAAEAVKSKSKKSKTWHYKAEQVRDFAFASSRRFIWDASSVAVGKKRVLAMSLYSKEAMPLWDRYATHLIRHTIEFYSKYLFEYPYPTAVSVHANDNIGGMEYPMISFSSARPEFSDGYSESVRDYLILVTIHEVGHNYFPMIINSDERQWKWLDEGLNSFVQYLAEKAWDSAFPSDAGPADLITSYMKRLEQVPIMSNAEAILDESENAYNKPTAGLNILRETILGPELFDFAIKEYARRWKFKSPEPADFFRTMEDASGRDLGWFFYNWFYTTKYVNQSITKVEELVFDQSENASFIVQPNYSQRVTTEVKDGYAKRNRLIGYTKADVDSIEDSETNDELLKDLQAKISTVTEKKQYIYRLTIENVDDRSMVMPIILGITYEDSRSELIKIPAKAWIRNEKKFVKQLTLKAKAVQFVLDPNHQLPDVDRTNNSFPPRVTESKLYIFDTFRSPVSIQTDSIQD